MPRTDSSKKRVRREDVAREAGVSSATVSYVVNGTKRLSPEVEQRVWDAVHKLNYKPDYIARSLAGSDSRTIALMTADIANVYQLEVIKGLQAEALKHDYVIIIFDASGDASKYVDRLIAQRVDGIFLTTAPDFMSDELLTMLVEADIEVLTDFSRSTFLPEVSYVMSDHYDGFMQAVQHLRELGHMNIGYLSAFDDSCYYDVRLNAFRMAMDKQMKESNPPVVCGTAPYNTSEELGYSLMQEMMEKNPDVTAVIATNDIMAIGAMRAIREAGKRVPQDYSVVGIDNVEKSATCTPPLTTVDQDGRTYGAKVFHILYDNIRKHAPGKFIIPMRLVRRESTGPVAVKG